MMHKFLSCMANGAEMRLTLLNLKDKIIQGQNSVQNVLEFSRLCVNSAFK